jgi:uncharacterized membrane protein YfcA
MPELAPHIWIFAVAITLVGGFVKGVVGFAMPMIMISGFASVMAPDLALAFLILPTVASNLWQAMRGGVGAAWASTRTHWRFLVVLLIAIMFSAQLVNVLPESAMFLILGVPVVLFAVLQLAGWRLRFPDSARRAVEVAVAAFAGFIGGLSGVWGPPTVMYLTALETGKSESVRVQGVVYGGGAVMLALSHVRSGVLTPETAMGSALMLVTGLIGMGLGFRVHDRIDQALFRRLTLVVLIVAGLNLVRRGLFA